MARRHIRYIDADGRTMRGVTPLMDLRHPMARRPRYGGAAFSTALYVVAGIVGYMLSNTLLDYYHGGDQFHYNNFFNTLRGESYSYVSYWQSRLLSSYEPLYGFVSWVGANLTPLTHNQYISIYNAILVILLLRFLIRNSVYHISIILIMTNFYFLVLLTGAERLKFAYLIILLALNMNGKMSYALLAAAPLAHFQTFIMYAALLCGKARYLLNLSMKTFAAAALGMLALSYILYAYFQNIMMKGLGYFSEFNIIETTNAFILLVAGLFILRDKLTLILSMLVIIVACAMLGGARINMIGITIFLYYVIQERRTANILFMALLSYFSFKSIDFVFRVIQTGHGFGTEPLAYAW